MSKLEEKYGNVHVIMGILVDEIRSLHVVRKGDFKAFEQLSGHVNEFHDRLMMMGRKNDAENSYILKEIESKLNGEDQQKWLESQGDDVDCRMVENLKRWLDQQTHLRRITYNNSLKYVPYGSYTGDNRNDRKKVGSFASATVNIKKCPNCSADHTLVDCPEFLKLTLNERWERVKYFRCCFICLKFGHRRMECQELLCQNCSGPHHTTLHNFSVKRDENYPLVTASGRISPMSNKGVTRLSRSFLPVVQVTLSHNEINRNYTALLDSGSEINIISSRCYQQLRLKGEPIVLSMVGVGGVINRITTKKVEVLLTDKFGEETIIECIILSQACGQVVRMNSKMIEICGSKLLQDKGIFTQGGEVDLLIGMSRPELHKQFSLERLPNGVAIMGTRFGYCLVGPTCMEEQVNYKPGTIHVNQVSVVSDASDEIMFRDHLQAELAGISREVKQKTEEEIKFEERLKFDNDNDDNRFQIGLPWKYNPETFQNNREQAVHRDLKLMKQLSKNVKVLLLVEEQIKEMADKGILRKVEMNHPKRYLPLLPITNLERESTKVRICMDAKCKFKGISFNDYLLKGKIDMTDIFQVLTSFRCGLWTIQGDIKKMFWQIKLDESDERYHGVIYNGQTYVFTRVCFGNKPSPIIANQCMMRISVRGKSEYPHGSNVIANKRYVDDILDASSNISELIQKRNETTQLLGNFGFEIKEWHSNNPNIGTVKENGKVLGLNWNAKKDLLSIPVQKGNGTTEISKRIVLSKIGEIWDPIGLLAGVLLVGRLIFQSIVRMKGDWDEEIDDVELTRKWYNWVLELEKCNQDIIARSILPEGEFPDGINCELIGFSDGSAVAHGCTLYLRWYDDKENRIEVKFIGAKSKVNSIKGTTVPRAEICGAFILSRLAHSAEQAFINTELEFQIKDKVFFTDSTTVLSWVKSASIKYKPYVKNKIIEIQELHPVKVWRYIPSSRNTTADLLSKGCTFKELGDVIKGPDMLYSPRSSWPSLPSVKNKEEIDSEKLLSVTVKAISLDQAVLDVNRFSSWRKLVRVTAYLYKYISKKRRAESSEEKTLGLKEVEFKLGEIYWILRAQKQLDVLSPQVKKLSPFRDEDGILRIYGRLKHMPVFDVNRKHPILLPKEHEISMLIVRQIHEECLHPGHLRVMAEVRKKFWIIGVRTLSKVVGKTCVICRKWRGTSLEQRMADLPSFRVTPGYPFENTAIDYFGPFDIRYGHRGRRKSYGAVFSCLTTRAVHLELVTDLSTDTFLLGFRRFISLYGTPKKVRTDNGRNFVGAAKEIRFMIKSWKEDQTERSKITEMCETKLIEWTFSTPMASHHNGAVESMVKCVKTSLNKVVKERVLSEEEYRTIFAEITTCINSRPLWPSSDGDVEQPVINCNDLLRPGGLPRDPVSLNVSCHPKKRYQQMQHIVNDWWRLWLLHFTPNLQCRNKWFKRRENLSVGDIVLIIDNSIARSQWNMAIVENIYPGKDGLVRSARIRSKIGIYDRPITKLCLLISKEEMEQIK